MIIDASKIDATAAFKLLIGCIVPRPIAWISTVSVEGVANLAPVSFYTGAARKPPMVFLALQPRGNGELMDTFVNIRDTGEFVINVATLSQAHLLHQSAAEFPPGVDEFDAVGVEKAPSEAVRAPRVAGAPISLECRLERIIPISELDDHLVLGIVERFHVRDDLYLERGRIDTAALSPIGRLAAEYTFVENVFVTPLDEKVLERHADRRMYRLDDRPAEYSPINSPTYSLSRPVV